MFNVGDKVVYPMHGAGTIDSIDKKNILDEEVEYINISMPGGVKVMVPSNQASKQGLRNIISQNDTDTIQNDTVRFFIYTDLNNWGFFVLPIQRKSDQLYLGRKEYFPYEDNLKENSYFDGNH